MVSRLFRVHASPRSAWLETIIAATINATGMALELSIGRSVPGMLDWPAYVSIGGALGILGTLFFVRKNPPSTLCSGLFLLNICFVVIALYLRNPYYAAADHVWVPFQANKLGCFIIALLSPSLGVGLLGIALHVGTAIVSYYFVFTPEIRDRLAFGEPVAMIAFGLAGLLTLISRMRRMTTEADTLRLYLETKAAKQLAMTMIRLRDLMNTPLQNIELSLPLLKDKRGNEEIAIESIEHAVDRLNELNESMRKYERDFVWRDGDESFKQLSEMPPDGLRRQTTRS
jgi:signal transduction histidine kinase